MSVRIGINPLTWTNDDLPELGKNVPLEQCLSEGKQAGYSGFELGNKFPREAAALKQVLEPHQLSLVSGWFSGAVAEISAEEEIERIQSHLSLLKALGAEVMVYCDTSGAIHCDQGIPLSRRPVLAEADWEPFCARLNKVAEYCLQQGVRLAYHHHMGTLIQTEEETLRLMASTSNDVGLLLDTGHLTFAKGDPIRLYNTVSQRVCHVHCKDIRESVLRDALNRDLSFLDAVLNGTFTVPGDGCVAYDDLFPMLKTSAYSGWLVVEAEQDPSIAPSLSYAKLGAENLKTLCQRHELTLTESLNIQ